MGAVKDRRMLGLIIALLALGAMSAFAALHFTSLTSWAINATVPPVEQYAGPDAAAYSSNIKVKSYVDTNTGLNVTSIYVSGYTGYIVNYTNALQVCNYYGTSSASVSIKYIGPVGGGNPNYVKQFVVYNPNTGQWVGFTYTGAIANGPVQVATLGPNQCVTLGVSVLVSGNSPSSPRSNSVGTAVPPSSSSSLAIYQVDIMISQ